MAFSRLWAFFDKCLVIRHATFRSGILGILQGCGEWGIGIYVGGLRGGSVLGLDLLGAGAGEEKRIGKGGGVSSTSSFM